MVKCYSLEVDEDAESRKYLIYKEFQDGRRLLWDRKMLRKHAVEFITKEANKDGVPMYIRPGVFRRKV